MSDLAREVKLLKANVDDLVREFLWLKFLVYGSLMVAVASGLIWWAGSR